MHWELRGWFFGSNLFVTFSEHLILPSVFCSSTIVFLWRLFSVNWGQESRVQPDTLWLCILTLPCNMERVLHLLMGRCSLPLFIFPRKSCTGQLSLSACCRMANTHLDITSGPCATMLLQTHHFTLTVAISQLMLCARDKNKRALPALESDSAAAAKSECRDDSEESKLLGTQNLQL